MSNSCFKCFYCALILFGFDVSDMAIAAQVNPLLLAKVDTAEQVDVILVLPSQTSLHPISLLEKSDYRVRRRALVEQLKHRATVEQASIRTWLDAHGLVYKPYWIANVISVQLPVSKIAILAQRNDISRIEPNLPVSLPLPHSEKATVATTAIAWGVSKIKADLVWAMGITGQNVVIAGQDTGYQWDHPALKSSYRGWNGASADHNYNWHDAIDNSTGNSCGNNTQAPCDDDGHGTHTMGTMLGDDGVGNQIGVAPGATWIGCRNMDEGFGTPASYISCMQWFMAPTDLNDQNPNPDSAPDIISNSWSCPTYEGCTVGNEIQSAVDNLVAGGIFFVAAAQNNGAFGCSTIYDPPAIYDSSFVVGATDSSNRLASFSSRGPVTTSTLIRPDISAPGVNICSSIPGNNYSCAYSGTSMATPHVAGVAALLMSANPNLKGVPEQVAQILRQTAMQTVQNTQGVIESCGGTSITTWPNYMAGYGLIDAWAGFELAEAVFTSGFDS